MITGDFPAGWLPIGEWLDTRSSKKNQITDDHWLDSSHLWQWTSLNWANFGICWVWFPICYPLCGPSFSPTKKTHGTPGGLPSAEATRYACRVCERPSGKMLWVATSTSKKLWTSLNVVNIHHNWYKLIIDIICINLFIECSSTYTQYIITSTKIKQMIYPLVN